MDSWQSFYIKAMYVKVKTNRVKHKKCTLYHRFGHLQDNVHILLFGLNQ